MLTVGSCMPGQRVQFADDAYQRCEYQCDPIDDSIAAVAVNGSAAVEVRTDSLGLGQPVVDHDSPFRFAIRNALHARERGGVERRLAVRFEVNLLVDGVCVWWGYRLQSQDLMCS